MIFIIATILGLAFGSFAGALVIRLHDGRDFVSDRSRCDNCDHILGWKDLMPLISWLSLKGRCRYCKQPISWYNPLIELVMTSLFLFSVWQLGTSSNLEWIILGVWLAIVVCMVIIAAYDIRHFQIPMTVAYIMLGFGLVLFGLNNITGNFELTEVAVQLLLQLVAALILIVLPHFASRGKWMGSGDISLAVLSGLVMTSVLASFAGVMTGFYLGTLVVVPLLVSGKVDRRSKIPFGPFILSGIFIWFVWQQPLEQLFLGLLGL